MTAQRESCDLHNPACRRNAKEALKRGMWKRMWAPLRKNAVFFVDQSTLSRYFAGKASVPEGRNAISGSMTAGIDTTQSSPSTAGSPVGQPPESAGTPRTGR